MNGWWLWVGSGRVRVGARKEHTRPHSPLTTFALAHPVRFVHYAHYAHTFRSLSLTTFAHFTRYARSGPGFTPAFGSSPWLLRYVPLRSLTSPRSHSLVHFAHYVRYATVTPAHSLPTPFASLTHFTTLQSPPSLTSLCSLRSGRNCRWLSGGFIKVLSGLMVGYLQSLTEHT